MTTPTLTDHCRHCNALIPLLEAPKHKLDPVSDTDDPSETKSEVQDSSDQRPKTRRVISSGRYYCQDCSRIFNTVIACEPLDLSSFPVYTNRVSLIYSSFRTSFKFSAVSSDNAAPSDTEKDSKLHDTIQKVPPVPTSEKSKDEKVESHSSLNFVM